MDSLPKNPDEMFKILERLGMSEEDPIGHLAWIDSIVKLAVREGGVDLHEMARSDFVLMAIKYKRRLADAEVYARELLSEQGGAEEAQLLARLLELKGDMRGAAELTRRYGVADEAESEIEMWKLLWGPCFTRKP